MIERVCGICGSVWSKSFNFCPSDGSQLVAVDALLGSGPGRPASRKASSMRAFTTPEPGPQPVVPAAKAPSEWTNPVFTARKNRDAGAFLATACHKRPSVAVALDRALAPDPAPRGGNRDAGGTATNPTQRSLPAPRVGDELVH